MLRFLCDRSRHRAGWRFLRFTTTVTVKKSAEAEKRLDNSPSMPYNNYCCAGVAHLVERDLAKVEVASSSLVARSKKKHHPSGWCFFLIKSGRGSKGHERSEKNMPVACFGARVRVAARQGRQRASSPAPKRQRLTAAPNLESSRFFVREQILPPKRRKNLFYSPTTNKVRTNTHFFSGGFAVKCSL